MGPAQELQAIEIATSSPFLKIRKDGGFAKVLEIINNEIVDVNISRVDVEDLLDEGTKRVFICVNKLDGNSLPFVSKL